MAFPDDLNDVVVLKIHPAIGIARVSKNEDYFIFGTKPDSYKSNGLMKRQAVQFRIFAYAANNVGLGELTPAVLSSLNIKAVWSAQVANRKLRFTALDPDTGPPQPDADQRLFGATASSDDAQQGKLVGKLPAFAEGQSIPLGQITSTGLFIPPKAGVFRETAGMAVPDYPDFTFGIADTTSDGSIRVALDGPAQNIPVLPAWIIVAPGDYSPDVDSEPVPSESLLVLLREKLGSSAGTAVNIHNETARRLDEAAIQPCSADWLPGFETSMGSRSEVPDIKALFYSSQTDPAIHAGEMRIKPKEGGSGTGAIPGQLTSGLCSPWQTDFTACIGYWAENLPLTAFLDEDNQVSVRVYRKQYSNFSASAPRLRHGDDFERHQDEIGVVRLINGKPIETERKPGDDIIDTGV
jgi:hypothetical protein